MCERAVLQGDKMLSSNVRSEKTVKRGKKRVPQLCNTNGQQWFVCVSQVCNDDHSSFITGLYSITHTFKLAVQNKTAQKAVSAWKIK